MLFPEETLIGKQRGRRCDTLYFVRNWVPGVDSYHVNFGRLTGAPKGPPLLKNFGVHCRGRLYPEQFCGGGQHALFRLGSPTLEDRWDRRRTVEVASVAEPLWCNGVHVIEAAATWSISPRRARARPRRSPLEGRRHGTEVLGNLSYMTEGSLRIGSRVFCC